MHFCARTRGYTIIMAAEEEPVDLEENENLQESKTKKSAKHDSGAADLEKVTDYVEEAEISSKNLDYVSYCFDFLSNAIDINSELFTNFFLFVYYEFHFLLIVHTVSVRYTGVPSSY